jgi:hypothetical protein
MTTEKGYPPLNEERVKDHDAQQGLPLKIPRGVQSGTVRGIFRE